MALVLELAMACMENGSQTIQSILERASIASQAHPRSHLVVAAAQETHGGKSCWGLLSETTMCCCSLSNLALAMT